jgi:hypothetical protein
MHIVRRFTLALLLVTWLASPAAAVLQFYNVFKAEYLDDHPDQEWVALVKKPANRCFICHQGKSRKNHNPYGEHLVPLLDRRKDAKDKDKILAALKEVEVLPFDPENQDGEKYADRIAAGQWPGGELDDLKAEPEGSDEAE